MSSPTHSSAVCNDNVSPEGNNPPPPTAAARPFNQPIEAGPSAIGGALSGPALSDTITPSPECSSSGSASVDLNHNRNSSSNGAFRNGDTIAYGSGSNDRWYDQVPYPPFPRVQPRLYMPPLLPQPMYPVPFVGNPFPFIWPAYQAPVGYSYVPFDAYHHTAYPFHPQAQYFRAPLFGPRQDIYAAHQSYFSAQLDILRIRLRKQIEYYFSSENLCTDFYLKKHMDAHGWVPISLIEKFRKVQQIMKERQLLYDSFGFWDVIQEQAKQSTNINVQFISSSLRPSNAVEVQGDKVRKRHER